MNKQEKEYLTNKQNDDFDFDYVESHSSMGESIGIHAGAVKVNIE